MSGVRPRLWPQGARPRDHAVPSAARSVARSRSARLRHPLRRGVLVAVFSGVAVGDRTTIGPCRTRSAGFSRGHVGPPTQRGGDAFAAVTTA